MTAMQVGNVFTSFTQVTNAMTGALVASPEVATAVALGLGSVTPAFPRAALFADNAPDFTAKPVSALSEVGARGSVAPNDLIGYLIKPVGIDGESEILAYVERSIANGKIELEILGPRLLRLEGMYRENGYRSMAVVADFWRSMIIRVFTSSDRPHHGVNEFLDVAENIGAEAENITSVALVNLARGRYLASLGGDGHLPVAIACYRKAIESNQLSSDDERAAAAEMGYLSLVNVGLPADQPEVALNEAREKLLGGFNIDAMAYAARSKELARTPDYHKQADAIYDKAKMNEEEIRELKILQNSAGAAMHEGRYSDAAKLYEKAAEDNAIMGRDDMATRYKAMSELAKLEAEVRDGAVELGNPEHALAWYQSLEESYAELLEVTYQIRAIYSQARVLRSLGRYDKADAEYLRGAELKSDGIANLEFGNECVALGDIYMGPKLWDRAKMAYEKSDEAFTKYEESFDVYGVPKERRVELSRAHLYVLERLIELVDTRGPDKGMAQKGALMAKKGELRVLFGV